jgi:hypothetical protein
MECSEVKQHLPAYYDGELSNDVAEAVKTALVDCPECQQELEELALLSELARDGFNDPVANVDFSQLADQVMAKIQAEAAVEGVKVERQSDASVGMLDALSNFFGELLRFERPMAAMAGAALVVLLVVGLQTSDDGAGKVVKTEPSSVANNQTTTPQTETVAQKSSKPTTVTNEAPTPVMAKKKTRRARVLEEQAGQRDMAAIESKRAPAGVRIDIDQDQGRPAIVWHVDEDVEDAPN